MKSLLVYLTSETDLTDGDRFALFVAITFAIVVVSVAITIFVMSIVRKDKPLLSKYTVVKTDKANINSIFSNEAQQYLKQNNILVCNSRLYFKSDYTIKLSSKFITDPNNILCYRMFFSYVAISDNCIYVLFDHNQIRKTVFENSPINTITLPVHNSTIPGAPICPAKRAARTMNKNYASSNPHSSINIPSFIHHSDELVNAVREYLSAENYKIVIVNDFRTTFKSPYIYSKYDKYNEQLNYSIINKCKINKYKVNYQWKKVKPTFNLMDKRIGQLISVIKESNNIDAPSIDLIEKERMINLLWSNNEHKLDVRLKFESSTNNNS